MKTLTRILFCIAILPCIFSCSDDKTADGTGSLLVVFDNVVGEQDLTLSTAGEPYTNAAGESYRITTLKYYISDVKLTRSDGVEYKDETSLDGSKGYYLVDESDAASQRITLENVPEGDYTQIAFTIGVDVNDLTEGAQTGPLDPAKGMFWSWNTGFIFVKMEGVSAESSDDNHRILYHVGGYTQPNNLRTKTEPVGDESAMVRAGTTPEVRMIIDVNKFFDGPNVIRFADTPIQNSPEANAVIADNYVNTFVVGTVHN